MVEASYGLTGSGSLTLSTVWLLTK
jgi:hypothetical protein